MIRSGMELIAWQGLFRVFVSAAVVPTSSIPHEGKHRNLKPAKKLPQPFREPAAVIPARARGFDPGRRFETPSATRLTTISATSGDTGRREPETHFAKHLDGGRSGPSSGGDHRCEVTWPRVRGNRTVSVGGDGTTNAYPGHYPAEPVGPPVAARPRPQRQIGREVAKGFIFEVRQQ